MTIQQAVRSHRSLFVFASIAVLAFLGFAAGSSAGIQGSGRFVLSYGSITAFGSIFVDGVEYDVSSALITIDGTPATASQLELGQIVTVQGVRNGNGPTGTAASVSFTGEVIGSVSSIDSAGGSMTILGQTVRVDDSTLFGAGIQPASLAGLRPGLALEVSAFDDASGNLRASRIDLHATGSSLQVRGTVTALDTTVQTFRINDLTVDYSGTQVHGTLANGATATVQAPAPPAGTVLYASQVQLSQGLGGAANAQGQTEGLITSLASSQSFWVGDQQVQTNSSTSFVLHGQTLAPNLEVNVQGTFTASGVLVADQVEALLPQAGHGSTGSARTH